MSAAFARLDLSTRAAAGVTVLGLFLLSFGGWLVLVHPKRSEASRLDARIQEARAQLAVRRSRPIPPKGLSPSDLRGLRQAMPDTPEMPGVVSELSRLAGQAGVTLDTITPLAAIPAGGYLAVPMTVVVDGQFFAVRDFLRRLRGQVAVGKHGFRATGRLFDVQSLDLEQTEPAPQVRASFQLQAFVLGGGTGGGGSAPAAPPPAGSAAGATG